MVEKRIAPHPIGTVPVGLRSLAEPDSASEEPLHVGQLQEFGQHPIGTGAPGWSPNILQQPLRFGESIITAMVIGESRVFFQLSPGQKYVSGLEAPPGLEANWAKFILLFQYTDKKGEVQPRLPTKPEIEEWARSKARGIDDYLRTALKAAGGEDEGLDGKLRWLTGERMLEIGTALLNAVLNGLKRGAMQGMLAGYHALQSIHLFVLCTYSGQVLMDELNKK